MFCQYEYHYSQVNINTLTGDLNSLCSDKKVKHKYCYRNDILEAHMSEKIKGLIISMFHRAFFNLIIDKIPTHALFIQHYISLAC